MSTSARLAGIIAAIAVFAIPALGLQGEALGRAFHEAAATAIWPYVFDDLYGGLDGAYGPEIYVPEQTYLQTYLSGGPPVTAYAFGNREPLVRSWRLVVDER